MATIIDGKRAAATLIDRVKSAAASLRETTGIQPGLAVVLVGSDPASQVYVASKTRTAAECGFRSQQFSMAKDTSQPELASMVDRLNADESVHGILVQLPLPSGLRADPIIQSIMPEKDVDGLHVVNAGRLSVGDGSEGLVPCTPAGAMRLVEAQHGRDLSGLNALVIGRSNLFGKPMSALLLRANATVTTAHSRTTNLSVFCSQADILIAAVGQAELVRGDWVKPGATVIDVGINRVADVSRGIGKTRLVGDVEFATASTTAGAITPVPGGVGPMTIAMLMANTLTAAYRRCGLASPELD